jgi:hypothetical protein
VASRGCASAEALAPGSVRSPEGKVTSGISAAAASICACSTPPLPSASPGRRPDSRRPSRSPRSDHPSSRFSAAPPARDCPPALSTGRYQCGLIRQHSIAVVPVLISIAPDQPMSREAGSVLRRMYRNASHTDGGGRVTGLAIRPKRHIGPVLTCRAGDPVRADADVAIHHRPLNPRCGSRPKCIRAVGTTSVYCGLEQDASRARSEVSEQHPVETEKPNSMSYRRVDDHREGRLPIPTRWRRSVWRPDVSAGRPATSGWAF